MVAHGTGHRRKLTVPMWSGRRPLAGELGQATAEFVALLPIFVLAAMVMGQASVAGYAAWSAAGAARVGARAQALGEEPGPAVREALPAMLLQQARILEGKDAQGVTIRLHIPSVFPGLRLGTVEGRAQFPSQVGA